MLEPIKSTKSTGATQATEATDAVRPISEQRPGNTLQDRFYKAPEISGGAKKPSASGNSTSLYQQYSLAKQLPTTPVAPLPPATPGSTFSNFASKYTNYSDFWSGLGMYQRAPAQQEYIHWNSSFGGGSGEGYIDPSLKPYILKYGNTKGMDFIKSLKAADELQANRQNPYYQPINLNKMDKYFLDDEALDFTDKIDGAGGKKTFSGILGGQDITLGKSEIDTLRKIAEDNGLGQTGFQELLDRSYKAKVTGAATAIMPKIQSAIDDPYAADWNSLRKDMSFQTEFTLDDFSGFADKMKKDLEYAQASIGLGTIAGEGAAQLGGLLNIGGAAGAAASVPIMAAVAFAATYFSQQEIAKLNNAKFSVVKNGKMATSIDEFSGSEKDNLKTIAEKSNVDVNELVKTLGAMQASALYDKGKKLEGLGAKYEESMKTDQAIQFGDSELSLSKTYNPFAKKETA